jgi:hypothetical protein
MEKEGIKPFQLLKVSEEDEAKLGYRFLLILNTGLNLGDIVGVGGHHSEVYSGFKFVISVEQIDLVESDYKLERDVIFPAFNIMAIQPSRITNWNAVAALQQQSSVTFRDKLKLKLNSFPWLYWQYFRPLNSNTLEPLPTPHPCLILLSEKLQSV